jgi:hypothetical protein
MSPGTIIVLIALLAIVALAIRSLIVQRKSACACGCEKCAHSCEKHTDPIAVGDGGQLQRALGKDEM